MRKAWYIFLKDVRQEFKTRYAINAILLFAVVTLTAVSFSIGTYSAGQEIMAALLWIILFFSSMSGLSHIFVREEETHTADTLKLVATASSVFFGKFFFNLILLFALEIIIIPLFLAVMDLQIQNFLLFFTVLMLGSFGLASGGTMVAAIISKASAKGALFTVLAFPILLPVIVSGISATKIAASETNFWAASSELQALFAYGVVVLTASVLLFEFVWNE
ncbi:MAG: heme exporter protein CcmB [Calditrichaceae bacterium]